MGPHYALSASPWWARIARIPHHILKVLDIEQVRVILRQHLPLPLWASFPHPLNSSGVFPPKNSPMAVWQRKLDEIGRALAADFFF